MSAQGFHQVQKQTQNLVLAPQLRQSLKILQVPALDLRNVIVEELQSNPALEELPIEEISIEESNSTSEDNGNDSSKVELEFSDDFKVLNQMEEDWAELYTQDGGSYSSEAADRRQHMFDSLTSETSLQEYLIRQAELSDASEEIMKALEYLVGSLDDHGFLTIAIPDIALMSELPLSTIQEAHKLLKTLDPSGIGSVDLQECLITQLKIQGKEEGVATDIIKNQFELLLRRRIPEIARKINMSIEIIENAIEEIASLDPSPGRRFSDDNNRVVIPDVKVEKDGDSWTVVMNNDYIPRLRLSTTYKDLIAKGKLSATEKVYIQDKVRSGKFLISSIEQRQQTIERITREILKFQNDFFEKGVSHLRPLTMSQVADEVGVHETTVSRAIANKYIDTPHGVLPFKYFFTSGYQADGGEAISNTSIKERIAHLIHSENSSKPYSDQEVVKILAERDIKIARRTVAKYREELGIPATNLRRRYS